MATSELAKTCSLIGTPAREVPLRNGQHNIVQPERGECVVKYQAGRFGAITLAAVCALANEDEELRGTVAMVNLSERRHANGFPVRACIDGEPCGMFVGRSLCVPLL